MPILHAQALYFAKTHWTKQKKHKNVHGEFYVFDKIIIVIFA